jgi:chromosome segregation protein
VQLTRLRLSGFKSFSDPVEVRIEDGLTGVVGPNGCGKSNIVEALRWAMGESSAKGLRGGEMEDVIFNGSGSRPAFDVAEVRLGLLGAVEGLPELRGAEEVEVARRISRGQGSVYRINGREARARDVQLLFADAGSGARSPAIVGQGQIGFVVESKPQERRRLLEDAAGIGGLHGRRREAEAKLAATEANLRRVLDLLREQEARLAELERQDKQARRYREVSSELREVEQLYLLARHREAGAALRAAREGEQAAQAALDVAGTATARARRERGELAGRLPGLRDGLAELAARLATLVERRAQLAAALERAGAHRAALARQRDEVGADGPPPPRGTRRWRPRCCGWAGRPTRRRRSWRRRARACPRPRRPTRRRARRWPPRRRRHRDALARSAHAQAALGPARALVRALAEPPGGARRGARGWGGKDPPRPAPSPRPRSPRATAAVEERSRRLEAAEAALAGREAETAAAREAAGRAAAAAARAREDLAAAEARHRETQAAARHAAERRATLERSGARLAERERAHAARLTALGSARAALDIAALQAALDAAEAALREADARLDAASAGAGAAEAERAASAAAALEAGRALDALTAEVKVLESLAAEVPEGAVLSRLRIPEGMARALAARWATTFLATDDACDAPLRRRELGPLGEGRGGAA